MNRWTTVAGLFVVSILAVGAAKAATLKVGPGAQYAKPSQAIAAAKNGDVIEIDTKGDYSGDVTGIGKNNLTLRGVGSGRAKLNAHGKNCGGKGTWVITGSNTTIENVEFSGARVRDRNGAGIRQEGPGLTLRNCRFYDCENGILGGNGEMLIEYCEFDHCGLDASNPSHNLYIGHAKKLTFQYNYSTDATKGHLLKSRAEQNFILYNRIVDGKAGGSAVIDLPNGGYAVIIGNSLQKSPKSQNNRVIAFGMEGCKYAKNALYVINNTMVFDFRHKFEFVHADKAPAGFTPVIRNNLCIGTIPLTNCAKAEQEGNLLLKSVEEAGLVDAAKYDYHLKADSPAIGKGVAAGMAGEFDLTPKFQYVHPYSMEKRPSGAKLDVGAFQHGASPKGASQHGVIDRW